MSKRLLSHLAIFSANLIYGLNYTIAKEIMPDFMHPFGLVFCRILGAILLFWSFSLFTFREKIARKDLIRMIVASLFGVATNQTLFLTGLRFTTPIDASIIMTVNPILVLIVASIFIGEKITGKKILGIIIGATGAITIILYSGQASFSSDNFIGNVMVFFNALSYGIYLVTIKPLMLKYNPITVMRWVFLFGFVFVFPISYGDFLEISWKAIPLHIYFAILFVIICATFLAYLLNVYGLKRLNASTVSIYIYSQPIIASIVAVILGKDELTFVKITSTILVFIGVYLVSTPQKKKMITKY